MPGLSVNVAGLDQLLQKLERAVDGKTLQPVLERAAENIRDRLRQYPAERPAQSYERTGNLGRGWKANGTTVSNSVEYGPWVQGDKQAWMHKGRWTTVQQAVDQERPRFEQEAADTIGKVLDQ